MDDRHDDVEDWLSGRVEPLYPPAGTFDLIRRRARRRKYRKLAVTAGAAAVVVAAAVTVPQVVNFNVLTPTSNGVAAAGHPASVSPRTGGGIAESSSAHPSFPVSSAAPTVAPVPADFRPTSVTFVGTGTGWVIGQAGTPGHCATAFCTSVARTDNAGNSWAGVPAPVTGPSDGATGVSQIRFLNLDDGWAFGPELWATHDGGQTWTAVDTHGQRVTDLETVDGRVFAVFATCTGGGAAFAGGCTSFTLYSSPARTDAWAPVGATTSGMAAGAHGGSASLSLTETRGYLLAPDGSLYSGPVSGSAPWKLVARIPTACEVGPAQQDGQPAGALLGAEPGENVILVCTSAQSWGNPDVQMQDKLIFASADGGASWRMIAAAPTLGAAASVAASAAEAVILATDRGIDVLPAGGATWKQLTLAGVPAGGFRYVGMTTGEQGVALPADPRSGAVWFTFDGGRTWAPSAVSGP
jgi:hypothetical protein